jgi:aminomethyltransferase
VRTGVGVFDVSHLGKVDVTGSAAAAFVDRSLTGDLSRIGAGQAQYTLCCDDATGGVVDDLIAYLRGDAEVFLVPNAANAADVVRRLTQQAPDGVHIKDRHDDFGVLAVQGPRSGELLERLGLPTEHPYMSFVDAKWNGQQLVVCRSGYTGERGYELLPLREYTDVVWDALLDAGADLGVRPCGLGARDTLRTEMGYPLHGQDLSLEITPVQARLGWAVGWKKPAFWGRDVLLAEREAGPRRRLSGIEALDRGIPRPHMSVTKHGRAVGNVTSGTFSPTRKLGIGLALLDADIVEGDEVQVDVRGRTSTMRVVKPPFVQTSTK